MKNVTFFFAFKKKKRVRVIARTRFVSFFTFVATKVRPSWCTYPKFILNYLICHYGVPQSIISDNGTPFKNQDVHDLCEKFKIQHHFSTPYYSQGNGQVEAKNKTILKILKKIVNDAVHDWHLQLNPSLWSYQTNIYTPTGATPFSLVYRSKVVLPIKIKLLSLRISLQNLIMDEEY